MIYKNLPSTTKQHINWIYKNITQLEKYYIETSVQNRYLVCRTDKHTVHLFNNHTNEFMSECVTLMNNLLFF